jgi:hypothetical protein
MRLDVRHTDEVPAGTAEAFRADLEVQAHREVGEESPGWQEHLSAFARERAAHYGVDIRITTEAGDIVYDLLQIHGLEEREPAGT